MLPLKEVELRYYVTVEGVTPFTDWVLDQDNVAQAKIVRSLTRMEKGNFSNVKGVGGGIFEFRIDFGPGYRIYFAFDGETLVLLLGGGTKKQQQRDIDAAKKRWLDYKSRKK